jgi:CBS-domain-containing membrane protein
MGRKLLLGTPLRCSCIALLHAIHGVMHFLHSLHPCNSAVAKQQISVPEVVRDRCGFMKYPD